MIYKIVRAGVLAFLFVAVMLPLLIAFRDNFGILGDFSGAVASFLASTGSFFRNVHGLINQFLNRGLGTIGITVFNILVHLSLIMPIFGFSARLYVFIRRDIS